MYETAVCPPTIRRSVYVDGCGSDVELCVDGPRFTALLSVDGEEPTASRGALRAGMYQSQVTIPHDSQHSVIPLLDEITRL